MRKLVYLLICFGLILLFFSLEINFTGAVIGTEIDVSNKILFVLSLTLFMVSFILYITQKSLEVLMIPTGVGDANLRRAEAAGKEYEKLKNKKHKPYILITGEIQRNKQGKIKKDSDQYEIYSYLRKNHHLKPSEFLIEGESKDTLENFLYSLKKLKNKSQTEEQNYAKVIIATNPTQYQRFKMFEKQAKKQGLLDKDFQIKPSYTDESKKDFIYGILANIKDYFRIKSSSNLEEAKNKKTSKFGNYFKRKLEDSGKKD